MSSNRLRTVAQRAAVPSRIFKVDVGVCSKCGGEMEIMSAVFDEFQVRRYLEHVELARDPPSDGVSDSQTCLIYSPLGE